VTYGANTQEHTSKAVTLMSDQQMTGVVVLSLGVAALIVSIGMAWTLSRLSCAGRVDSTWFITTVSFALFVVGIVLCWFSVSNLVGI
jgi:hypothetical protein